MKGKMDQKQCDMLLDRMVSNFLARNPDLSKKVHQDCLLYGCMSPETVAEIEKRMDAESV